MFVNGKVTINIHQCFSIPVLRTHRSACFWCFPPPHLIQMNGSLSGHCRAWWRADHLNQVWWRRETSKTNWETLTYMNIISIYIYKWSLYHLQMVYLPIINYVYCKVLSIFPLINTLNQPYWIWSTCLCWQDMYFRL